MDAKKPFRLQAVLRYRQRVETRLTQELARLVHAIDEAESSHRQQRQWWEEGLHTLGARQQSGLSATELFVHSTFLQRLSGEMAQQVQVVAAFRESAAQVRQRLEQAMRDRKILENLQEKARMQQRKVALQQEARTLAEIALRRFVS